MKARTIQKDENAFISTIINLLWLGVIAFVIYIFYRVISGDGFSLGEDVFGGLIDFAAGGLAALFTGDKGIFTSGRKIWSDSKLFGQNPWWGWNN